MNHDRENVWKFMERLRWQQRVRKEPVKPKLVLVINNGRTLRYEPR